MQGVDNNQPPGYYPPNQGYSQPQPQPQMDQHQHHHHHQQQQNTVVVVNQPQGTTQGQPQNIRQWTSGMCGCFEDCTGCMYCTFCHTCFMCSLAAKMNECECGPFCLGYTFETSMRTKLRAQFGIQGSVLDDVCAMLCCNPCASHQMYRELKHLGY